MKSAAPVQTSTLNPIKLDGASGLRIDGEGNLVANVEGQTVTLAEPGIYQFAANGTRIPVRGDYVLERGNEVCFAVSNYDHSRR